MTRVQSIVPPTLPRKEAIGVALLQRGLNRLGVDTAAGRLANDNAAVIVAYTSYLPNAAENKALLAELRARELPGLTLLVNGGTAEIVDIVDLMYADFPKAIALVVAATYLVLLVLFRSVLLPLKAVLMNALSILASYGALVWVFQEGNLSRFLGFTGLGFVEASLPVIMFCILFGLSMDYEVFLLSRIREEWERSGNNTQAVAVGLQRSGRIITSARAIGSGGCGIVRYRRRRSDKGAWLRDRASCIPGRHGGTGSAGAVDDATARCVELVAAITTAPAAAGTAACGGIGVSPGRLTLRPAVLGSLLACWRATQSSALMFARNSIDR